MIRVTVLGCGGSLGVPMSSGDWGTCDPTNPRNRRRRPSILIEGEGGTVLVDTGPDLSSQLIDAAPARIDAVLFTHAHADHVHGIDDLRPYCFRNRGPIQAFADRATRQELESRFGYAVDSVEMDRGLYNPILTLHEIPEHPFTICGMKIQPFWQDHAAVKTLGFRIGGFAYSTDAVRLPGHAFDLLSGVDTWIVDACREDPHPSHAHLEMTLNWIGRVRPRRAVLTHMNHTMDYDRLCSQLPHGVEPGYDGMVLDCR